MTNKTNLDFESITHFSATDDGVVDLDTSVPIGQTYYKEADPMGIFWTLYPLDPSEKLQPPLKKSDKRFWAMNVQNGLFCHFQVFDGKQS